MPSLDDVVSVEQNGTENIGTHNLSDINSVVGPPISSGSHTVDEIQPVNAQSSVPAVNPVDAGPVPFEQNILPDTVSEDYRRTKAYLTKFGEKSLDFTKQISDEQKQKDMHDRLQWSSPLSAAFKVGGWALDQAQKHAGRYAVNGIINSINTPQPNALGPNQGYNAPPDAPKGNDLERNTAASPALADVRPIGAQATPKQLFLRELFTTFGGNGVALNADEAKPALDAMGDHPLVNAIALSFTHEIGGLPLFVFGTGAGKAAVAGERVALETAALGMAPKEIAARTANLAAKEGAIEGAVQGGLQDAKNGETPGVGLLTGGLMGGILGKFVGSLTAKKEVLASANADRMGVGLPPLTAEAFFKDIGETLKAKPPTIRKAIDTSSLYPTESVGAKEVRPLTPTAKTEGLYSDANTGPMADLSYSEPKTTGNEKTPFSFRTTTKDQNGNLYLQHIELTAKGAKETYKTPITDKHLKDFAKNGLPIATDGEAYADLIDKAFPGKSRIDTYPADELAGTPQYMAPERVDAWIKANNLTSDEFSVMAGAKKVEPPTSTPAPATPGPRDDIKTVNQKPVILHEGKGGVIQVTPVVDGALDPTVISPGRARIGDIVNVGPEAMVVDKVQGGTVKGRFRDGRKVEVSQHDVSPLSEPELHTDSFKYNPDAVNEAHKRRFVQPLKKGEAELLAAGKLTVPRVMKIAEIDNPAQAAEILQSMQDRGLFDTSIDGEYYARKEYQPKFPELENKGILMYYDTSADGAGKIGVLRGRDPKNRNNLLLEVGNDKSLTPVIDTQTGARQGPLTSDQYTKAAAIGADPNQIYPKSRMISVPSEQIRTMKPVLMGDPQGSTLVKQLGVQIPLPPDTVVAQNGTVALVADATRRVGALSKLLSAPRAIGEGLMHFFAHDAMRIPTDIRDMGHTLAAQPGVVKANSQSYHSTLESQLGGTLSPQDKLLDTVVKLNATRLNRQPSTREVAMQKFFQANPQLGAIVQKTVQAALNRIKAGSEFLASRGFTNITTAEGLRASGAEDEYIVNSYMKHFAQRKEWAGFVKKQLPDVWQQAIGRVQERHPFWTSQQVEKEMLGIMGMDVGSEQAKLKTTPNGDVAKNLKNRLEMHKEIMDVMGKLDSASIQVAHSLATVESLVTRVKTWDSLQQTNYWSPGPRTDLGPHSGARVPDLPIYGQARNGYIHESMKFLLEPKTPMGDAGGLIRGLSKYWKFNVVPAGGAAPWVSNVMRNWKGMVLSGGLQGPSDMHAFFDAADMMLAYRDNSILNGHNSILAGALNNGTVSTGFVGSEINKARAANRVFDAIKKQRGTATTVWDIVADLPKSIKGTAQDIGAAYDTIDRIFKFASYLNIRRNGIAQGLSVTEAEALAGMRVQQSFPNYELVSPAIEKMRNGSISGIAPFLSSHAEDMRINATTIARLAKEPELWARLIVSAGVFAGAKGLLAEMRKANGISDEQVNAALAADKLSSQTFRSASFIGPEYDANGNLVKLDVSTYEDLLMLIQHNPLDPMLQSVMRNNLTQYFGESTLPGQAVDQLSSAAFGIRPLSANNPPTWKPGENGILTSLAYLAQHGGMPGVFNRQYLNEQKLDGTGNPIYDAQHPQWTPNEVIAKQMGLPFANPIGKETNTGRAMEMGQTAKTVAGQIKPAILNNMNDPQHANFLLDQKIQALQQVMQEYNNKGK